ncbi:hypothetical protein VTJ04DRAFT_3332 [Mycothermus thermophilus]|uniref:uncharacterized protein n=1 Tax=Humicola insolens TaxID=85995 RepID=UPI003742FE30
MPPPGTRPSRDLSIAETVMEEVHHQPQTNQPPSVLQKTWTYLNEEVRVSVLAELELLILTFCIGLQDAVSFPDFHCFASNQTGNTVFLVLAIVLPEADGTIFETSNIGVALGFFLLAAMLTGQLGHRVGPRRRGWLILCNLLQTCLVFAAAALQHIQEQTRRNNNKSSSAVLSSSENEQPNTATTLWAIGLLATAAGGQVVLSRALRMTEITTAMATAAWVDLLIDPALLAHPARNRPRNRRLGFLVALLLGTLCGAFVFRRLGSPAALMVSAAGKALVTGMFLVNPAERGKEVEREGRVV